MKKILPFSVNVPVKTYPNIAFYLGIIDGCGLDIKTLLFSIVVQLSRQKSKLFIMN